MEFIYLSIYLSRRRRLRTNSDGFVAQAAFWKVRVGVEVMLVLVSVSVVVACLLSNSQAVQAAFWRLRGVVVVA